MQFSDGILVKYICVINSDTELVLSPPMNYVIRNTIFSPIQFIAIGLFTVFSHFEMCDCFKNFGESNMLLKEILR